MTDDSAATIRILDVDAAVRDALDVATHLGSGVQAFAGDGALVAARDAANAGTPAVAEVSAAEIMSGGAVLSLPVVMRTSVDREHAAEFEAWCLASGITTVAPSTPADLKGLLLTAVFAGEPMVMIECEGTGPVPEGDVRVGIGSAVVRRAGRDITILAYGTRVRDAIAAADGLATEEIDAEVIDLRSLVPLDVDALVTSVLKTNNAVVVGAGACGGVAAEVSGRIHESLFGELEHAVVRVESGDSIGDAVRSCIV